MENNVKVLQNVNRSYDPAIPPLNMYLKERQSTIETNVLQYPLYHCPQEYEVEMAQKFIN